MSDFKLSSIETGGATGMDAFFASEPQIVSPVGEAVVVTPPKKTVRVTALSDLKEFRRTASDTLIHKSTNDLWALREENGAFVIERLFQDNGQPLKG